MNPRVLSAALLLHLLHLISESACRIFQVFLLDGSKGTQHDQFEQKVAEAHQDHEVVQSRLDFAHLG